MVGHLDTVHHRILRRLLRHVRSHRRVHQVCSVHERNLQVSARPRQGGCRRRASAIPAPGAAASWGRCRPPMQAPCPTDRPYRRCYLSTSAGAALQAAQGYTAGTVGAMPAHPRSAPDTTCTSGRGPSPCSSARSHRLLPARAQAGSRRPRRLPLPQWPQPRRRRPSWALRHRRHRPRPRRHLPRWPPPRRRRRRRRRWCSTPEPSVSIRSTAHCTPHAPECSQPCPGRGAAQCQSAPSYL
jgi:hypothetical protein